MDIFVYIPRWLVKKALGDWMVSWLPRNGDVTNGDFEDSPNTPPNLKFLEQMVHELKA